MSRLAWWLSLVLAVLMTVTAACGLLVDGLYQDPAAVRARFRAYDLTALALVVPIFALGLWRARHGGLHGSLLVIAVLFYAVYGYAFYVFEAAFNDLFLLHVAVFATALAALVSSLSSLDVAGVGLHRRAPARMVGALLGFLAAGLGSLWVFYSLRFAVSGELPAEALLVNTAEGTHLAYALDLVLLVPGYALAGILLWRRHAWGVVLGTVLLAAGVLQQVSYMLALPLQVEAGVPGAVSFDPQEPFIVAVFVFGAGALLGGLRGADGR